MRTYTAVTRPVCTNCSMPSGHRATDETASAFRGTLGGISGSSISGKLKYSHTHWLMISTG
jgi:hypothetical protein